jgi:hypothetical protein
MGLLFAFMDPHFERPDYGYGDYFYKFCDLCGCDSLFGRPVDSLLSRAKLSSSSMLKQTITLQKLIYWTLSVVIGIFKMRDLAEAGCTYEMSCVLNMPNVMYNIQHNIYTLLGFCILSIVRHSKN